MNAGAIWWEQLGASRRFLDEITRCLEAAESVILQIPEKMPWRSRFYSLIDLRKAGFSGERQMQRLEWQPGAEPGAFVLERLCSPLVRADYFPGQTYAEYLGGRGDILLCDYYVWITGVSAREDIGHWADFVTQYEICAEALPKRAVFVVEYSGPACLMGAATCLPYTLELADRQVFCLELAAALGSTPHRELQAELALRVGGDDPELAALLLSAGDAFVQNPVRTARELTADRLRSDRSRFEAKSEEQIVSAVRKAELVLLFPILEQWRFELVTRHEEKLRQYLPIKDSNGQKVEEPRDLELGTLYHIAARNHVLPKAEYEQLKLCRSVRNRLAHNEAVPTNEVYAVLRLQ